MKSKVNFIEAFVHLQKSGGGFKIKSDIQGGKRNQGVWRN